MSKHSTANIVPSRMMPRTPMQAPCRTMAAQGRLSQRARRLVGNAGIVLVVLLGACFAQFPRAAFAHGYEPPVLEFAAQSMRVRGCHLLAIDAMSLIGLRMQGVPRAEARDGLSPRLDRAAREQLEALIIEAYSWRRDPETWVASVNQRCLEGTLAAAPAATKAVLR